MIKVLKSRDRDFCSKTRNWMNLWKFHTLTMMDYFARMFDLGLNRFVFVWYFPCYVCRSQHFIEKCHSKDLDTLRRNFGHKAISRQVLFHIISCVPYPIKLSEITKLIGK